MMNGGVKRSLQAIASCPRQESLREHLHFEAENLEQINFGSQTWVRLLDCRYSINDVIISQ
jgi:hypothetical protein